MPAPAGDDELLAIHRELVARNELAEGMVYLQVTRGAADRDFAWPATPVPSLVLFTQARPLVDTAAARDGIRVITVPDIRWARRDIKTVQLLAPSMGKMAAKQAGKRRRLDGRGRPRHRGHLEQRLHRHRATARS